MLPETNPGFRVEPDHGSRHVAGIDELAELFRPAGPVLILSVYLDPRMPEFVLCPEYVEKSEKASASPRFRSVRTDVPSTFAFFQAEEILIWTNKKTGNFLPSSVNFCQFPFFSVGQKLTGKDEIGCVGTYLHIFLCEPQIFKNLCNPYLATAEPQIVNS